MSASPFDHDGRFLQAVKLGLDATVPGDVDGLTRIVLEETDYLTREELVHQFLMVTLAASGDVQEVTRDREGLSEILIGALQNEEIPDKVRTDLATQAVAALLPAVIGRMGPDKGGEFLDILFGEPETPSV